MVKSKSTVEQEAQMLIKQAQDISNQYISTAVEHLCSTSQVRDGVEYGYIIAALSRSQDYSHNLPTHIVGAAMKLRFNMSDEEYATTILGG